MGIIINVVVPVISLTAVMKDTAGMENLKKNFQTQISHTSIVQFAYSYSHHSYFSDFTLVAIVTASGLNIIYD